jgi:diguanylate cyclase
MRLQNLPTLFGGALLGGLASIAVIPAARSSIWAALLADPVHATGIGVVFFIPAALYGLWRYDASQDDRRAVAPDGSRELKATRAELQKQFSWFMTLIGEQLETSERHASSLHSANDRLGAVTSDAELRAVLRELIFANETYRRDSASLEHRLKEAQEQASNLRERARQAEKLASVDPLTGIANRRKFDEELEKQVSLSHSEETPLCLMMADIDYFKTVNDKFGHRAGDAVLRQFAELVGTMVRSTDTVARFGGEEFAIVLPRAPLGNAYEIAERIRKAVQSHTWQGSDKTPFALTLTASIGIADIRDGETAIDLINRADKKLYEAKASGRNKTLTWSSAA